MSTDAERETATQALLKRMLSAKLLMLSCERCKSYFECARYERYCIECRPAAGRAT
jgi:hypothetical protein